MRKQNVPNIKWKELPEEHDYPAANDYLSLIYSPSKCRSIVNELQYAEISHFKVKDIFRASGLAILGKENYHVRKNLKKIKNKENMVPLLLVRDSLHGKVIIADGYHRMCSCYTVNEDELIPCKIISINKGM